MRAALTRRAPAGLHALLRQLLRAGRRAGERASHLMLCAPPPRRCPSTSWARTTPCLRARAPPLAASASTHRSVAQPAMRCGVDAMAAQL